MRRSLGVTNIGLLLLLIVTPAPVLAAEANWESLLAAADPAGSTAGKWTKSGEALSVNAVSGARLTLPAAPQGEYDFRVTFTRRTGQHSIALIFPHGDGQGAFEVDAWGMHLAGLQNVAGRSIRENATRKANMQLENGRKYTMTVEVRKDRVRALLDDQVVCTHLTDGKDLSVPELWAIPEKKNLGIGAWESETTFHKIEARLVSGRPLEIAKSTGGTTKPNPSTSVPKPTVSATPPKTATKGTSPGAGKPAGGKRVLIVIANHHFFYREYGDPRAEFEKAGFKVTVAAGRKGTCRSHQGSGEGSDGGVVQADVALADVKADDYDAVLFSGGWGASAYQFAFTGRYNDPAYNGERAVKAAANKVINDFVARDKYVCALCNGVSVLAWARVDGKSPLSGKLVCAPTREAPAGVYNGRPAQPSCRWHPEANGAKLSPAGSIGRPGTSEDDVVVDGKIVTGEDDPSAREMGRRIVELLSQK